MNGARLFLVAAILAPIALLASACTAEDPAEGTAAVAGEIVPPFEVSGDCEGLLLVWFDEEGRHTAQTREEIPAVHRETVRVDSLRLRPEQRLDPAFVYVADLRNEVAGSYRVRQLAREEFEASLRPDPAEVLATGEVVIYGADWCQACRAAGRFFEQKQVEFVDRNIEHEPGARAEMQRKLREAGLRSNGIPVIDFRGTILTGFDRARLTQLIDG